MKTIFSMDGLAGRVMAVALLLAALSLAPGCDKSQDVNPYEEAFLLSLISGSSGNTVTLSGLQWKKCSQGQLYDSVLGTCRGNAILAVDDGIYGAVTLNFCSQNDTSCNTLSYPLTLTAPSGSATSGIYTSCASDTTAGFTDWRVPTLTELQTILLDARSSMVTYFPDTVNGYYWTATADDTDLAKSDVVSFRIFDYGEYSAQDKTTAYYLRCVRNP